MTSPCLFALLCLWLGHSARCQKIEKYYDFNWRDTTATHARFYSLTEKTDSGWRRRDYYLHNLTLQMEGLYSDSACKVGSGSFLFFHPTRIVSSMGVYRAGRREGLWLRFYSDGTMEDSTVYVGGQAVGIRKSWWRIALDAVRKSTNWIPVYRHNRKERTTIRQPVVFSQPN